MIEHFLGNLTEAQALGWGPLRPHLESFAQLLREQGYSQPVGRQKIRLLAELSQWLERKRIDLAALDEGCIGTFLRARRQRLGRQRADRSTLAMFLQHLRQANVVPAQILPPVNDGVMDRLERDYARFLREERGLSQATLDTYLPEARRFLANRVGARRCRLGSLCHEDVSAFVLRATACYSRKRVQLMTTALRSLLSFLYQRGRLLVNLAGSVPTVASWRWSNLPSSLEVKEVGQLLRSCDQGSRRGQRDYAVLVLLARLGLRAGEVAHLNLEDIGWETGELLIRGKSARQDRLPLLHEVGRALAKYLKNGRPVCSSRRVFIRANAPHQGFAGASAVCGIVRRALQRAQLHPAHQGAHVLRHSLATAMLGGGASLTQIGQILRHQQAQTTAIYARVDLRALRALAQPWPGGGQ